MSYIVDRLGRDCRPSNQALGLVCEQFPNCQGCQYFKPVMSEQQVQELRDIQGFIEFCINNHQSQTFCLANIGHDCGLLIRHDEGATPRTGGYSKYLPWGQGENKKG